MQTMRKEGLTEVLTRLTVSNLGTRRGNLHAQNAAREKDRRGAREEPAEFSC
jgi:hypothetical protein